MSNPLTFLRPLRYDRVARVLLVQSGPADQLSEIVTRIRRLFPSCGIDVLMREADALGKQELGVARVEVARWEDRFELVNKLRGERYDVVAMQLTHEGNRGLRWLPLFLRTRSIIAFNDRFDYFEVNVFRAAAIAHHLGGGAGGKSAAGAVFTIVRRAVQEAILTPAIALYLALYGAWLHLRGAWRQLRRGEWVRSAP